MEKSVQQKGGIEVSASDERDYRHLELENGLCVLLVSDKDAEKSAAAMDVKVGHQSDPEHLLGLAHFLEHMLFLGTAKYPDENSYAKFLSAHGGASNAYTSGTDTNFYFDVRTPYLHEALDRFAQFFIAPLFTASATEREMNAVHSEHSKNVQHDGWRMDQVVKYTSSRKHPFHKFGTGNLATLGSRDKAEVREELMAFHAAYYSARMMKLVIVGKEDLDTLERWARDLFGAIQDSGMKSFVYDGVPFEDTLEWQQRRLYVRPVKDLRTIEVAWPLPPQRQAYLHKPSSVLSHLIGHEGKGSLLSYLKGQGWVNELSAGLMKDYDDWSLFAVEMEATEIGMKEHVDDIVYAVYQYLHLLTAVHPSLPSYVFLEAQSIALMNFRFRSKEAPMQYATSLASKMQIYPKKHIVAGSHLLYEINPEAVTAMLALLTPSRMRLMIVCQGLDDTVVDQVEPWYETVFGNHPLSSHVLHRWSNPARHTALSLPDQNPFLPITDFELVTTTTTTTITTTSSSSSSDLTRPLLLRDDACCRLWCKTDTVFRKPKLDVCIAFESPHIYQSPSTVVLTDLFVRAVNDALTEFVYDAELAGLRYSLSFSRRALELYGSGYHQQLPRLLQSCIKHLTCAFSISEATFMRIVDMTKRSYENFANEDPYKHAIYYSACVLEDTKWTMDDKLVALERVTVNDVRQHAHLLFRQVFIEAYCHGNITAATSLTWMEQAVIEPLFRTTNDDNAAAVNMVSTSVSMPLCPAQRLKPRIVCLAPETTYIYERHHESSVENSSVCTLIQLGRETFMLRALNEVVAHMMKEPCFNQLRTQEQLGYIVFSSAYRSHGIEYIRFIVQSDVAPPSFVEARIRSFLMDFQEQIRFMRATDEHHHHHHHHHHHQRSPPPHACPSIDLAKHKQAVIDALLEKPKTAREACARDWDEIAAQIYDFDRRAAVAAAVETLTCAQVEAFVHTYFGLLLDRHKNPYQYTGSVLSIRVLGKAHAVPPAIPYTIHDRDPHHEKNTQGVQKCSWSYNDVDGVLGSDSPATALVASFLLDSVSTILDGQSPSTTTTSSSSSSSTITLKLSPITTIGDIPRFKHQMPLFPERSSVNISVAAVISVVKQRN